MLFTKLQGLPDDYVFDDFISEEPSNYKVLIKHLNHGFHKVENAQIDTTMFWRLDQRASKTEGAYAAELKCIMGRPI